MNAPCKDCPDREVGCHGTCEKYQLFRKSRTDYLEQSFAERESKTYWSKSSERKARRRMKEKITR